MPEDPFDDIDVVDDRDDAHRGAAVGTLDRIDLVNFLNQPGLAGLPAGIDRRVVEFVPMGCSASAKRPAVYRGGAHFGAQTGITYGHLR